MAAPAPPVHASLAAAGVQVGDFLGVAYNIGGRDLVHERVVVVLNPATPGVASIVTVDGDEYEEQFVGSADVRFWDLLPNGAPGGDLAWAPAARYYRFRAIPTSASLTDAARRACARLGLAAPASAVVPNVGGRAAAPAAAGAAAAPAPAVAPVAPVAGGLGALVAALGGPAVGAPAGVGAGALVAALGGPAGGAAGGALAPAPAPAAAAAAGVPAAPAVGGALAPPAGPGVLAPAPAGPAVAAAPGVAPPGAVPAPAGVPAVGFQASPGGDARIFAVVRDVRGVRRADFRVMVAQMVELPWPDWPVRGPRTLLWVLQYMAQRSGTPTAHHQRWLAETGLDPESPGVDIHQMGCMVLESAVTYDQEHATNLAHLELVARSVQVEEERYRQLVTPSEAGAADRAVMMGSQELDGSVCVCPALRDHLAQELQREMAVAKERRKAREERALAGGVPGQPGAGRGRGRRGRGGRGGGPNAAGGDA